jgi:GT2 family glycosyltransferase
MQPRRRAAGRRRAGGRGPRHNRVESRLVSSAPIAIFVYRRPEHTRRLLESLLANPGAAHAPVHVFSDAPRADAHVAAVSETRRVVRASGFRNLTIVERDRNLGLARSVIDGVGRLSREHGRVIVLEDDLLLAPTFLGYMNAALERYRETPNVFGVSGFLYSVDVGDRTDAVFLPFISSWGWATWDRAWNAFDPEARGYAALRADRQLRRRFDLDGNYDFFDMLEAQMQGRIDSWALRWYLSVFMRGGLTLFPARSLVENRGFGGEGEHCKDEAPPHVRTVATPFEVRRFPEPVLDEEAFRRVKRFVGRDFTLVAKARGAARAMLRRLARPAR